MSLVVGAAILRAGRVLAARRTVPPELAGGWEFPGGKVETGETPEAALVREVEEELGCAVEVTGWLSVTVPVGEHVLRVATARLVGGAPEPTEHDAIRWLSAAELDEVAWLDNDRPFLAELAGLLGAPRARGIFFEEDDARAVAARLASDGWEVGVERERYQGEDDDEDHPWAVVSDAPELVLDLLVDEYDGWLDVPEQRLPRPALDLPAEPRRLKRPR
ncbi:(deoxy)nucleoside triphosphate pyrophosphohydrolase [Nocardioides sp.]|uniref:(deoxy)nucleoside triphosphate pyrophosphohydrolase n=1 Tax=Nocardioides sp. TaxID=35761 RepID=UPI0039E396D4